MLDSVSCNFFLLSQNVKKGIWHSILRSEKSTGSLGSVVLDTSDELPLKKCSKGNRYIYRFVHQDLLPLDGKGHHGDSLSSVSAAADDMNCTLRSGDHVVCIFF